MLSLFPSVFAGLSFGAAVSVGLGYYYLNQELTMSNSKRASEIAQLKEMIKSLSSRLETLEGWRKSVIITGGKLSPSNNFIVGEKMDDEDLMSYDEPNLNVVIPSISDPKSLLPNIPISFTTSTPNNTQSHDVSLSSDAKLNTSILDDKGMQHQLEPVAGPSQQDPQDLGFDTHLEVPQLDANSYDSSIFDSLS